MMSSQRFLTTQEYAQKVGVSPSTVSKWLRSGKLQGQKQNGKWVIPEDTPTASSTTPAPAPQSAPAKTEPTSGGQSFSIRKFSEMTYLTEAGVLKWLKEGRLEGSKDACRRMVRFVPESRSGEYQAAIAQLIGVQLNPSGNSLYQPLIKKKGI